MTRTFDIDTLKRATEARHAALVDLARRMVQTPSPSGQEQDMAALVQAELKQLDYDDIRVDEAGNVIGVIKGTGSGPSVLLSAHMDHVDPGPAAGWPHPPFGGDIVEGNLWGRGSADIKGPLACMIYAAHTLKAADMRPTGDIILTAPVMEEVGCVGTRYLVEHLTGDVAICGEPSRNILRRGHRGRVELEVTFRGRSAHASMAHLGDNPHYAAAAFLTRLETLDMASHEIFGPASVAPTLYRTDQTSANVIPAAVQLTLDWRSVPGETAESVTAKVRGLLTGQQAEVVVNDREFEMYTGLRRTFPDALPGYAYEADDPLFEAARATLREVLGRDVGLDTWPFMTDGGTLVQAGIPTVGFGPGDERLAHTNQEHIPVAQMHEALLAYAALILTLSEAIQA